MSSFSLPASQPAHSAQRIASAKYVTVKLYALISGKSEGAIRKKIERGIWLEGRHYRRDPEGCIWINTEGVESWLEGTG
jgi:hypothetical protein